MKLKSKFPEAYQNKCHYCGANPNEPCKVVQAHYIDTVNSLCRDSFGRLIIHESRIKVKDGK